MSELEYEEGLRLYVRTSEDARNFINAVQENITPIESVNFDFKENFDLDELVTVLRSCKVETVSLSKIIDIDVCPILRALQFTQLESIAIHYRLSDEEYEALACALQNAGLHQFQYHVHYWAFEGPTQLWAPIIPVLSTHKSIVSILLHSVRSPAYAALGQILSQTTVIRKLHIGEKDDALTTEDMTHIVNGLKHNTTVKYLFIGGEVTSEALSVLCESFEDNQIPIEELQSGIEFTQEHVSKLSKSLLSNYTLKSLYNQDALQDPISCQLFSKALASNVGLKRIHTSIGNCGIDGAKYFFEALQVNKTIEELDLRLKNEQLAHFNLISRNSSLRKLSIWFEDLNQGEGNEPVDQLYEGLKYNTSITSCQFYWFADNEEIRNNVISKLIDVLEHNLALEAFHVQGHRTPEQLQPYVTRNIKLKSDLQVAVATISHNIARDDGALAMLPRELWISILSKVTHPGTPSFEHLIANIFDMYHYDDRKHERSQ